MKTLLLAVGLGIFLTGCATNPVTQFYQDHTKQMPVAFKQKLLPPNGNPRVIDIAETQHKQEIHHLEEQGYAMCLTDIAFTERWLHFGKN